MSDSDPDDTERSATSEEIREWSEGNDTPHPVFEVPNRPERKSVSDTERMVEVVAESQEGEQRSFRIAPGYTNAVVFDGVRLEIRAVGTGDHSEGK